MDHNENEQEQEQSRELELRQEEAAIETPMDKLRWSHRRFVMNYLENGYNAKQAALDAGYTASTSLFWGAELTKREDVKAAIAWGMEQQGITRPVVMGVLADIILNSDIGKFIEPYQYTDKLGNKQQGFNLNVVDEQGNVRPDTRLVQQVSVDKDGRVTIKMYSRLEALDKAAKALGMYSDVNINNNTLVNLNPDIISGAIERAKQFAADYEAQQMQSEPLQIQESPKALSEDE